MRYWHVVAVSRPGFSHLASGTPCEDAHAIEAIGNWFIGVVSDGAGSARYAGQAAAMLCSTVRDELSTELRVAIPGVADPDWLRPKIETAIQTVREKLEKASFSEPRTSDRRPTLADFHATLLGAVASPNGGTFFHIGDGVGVATKFKDFEQYIISPPENGEYANETYFFSQDDWKEHLRFTTFGREYDLILLMTDGVTPFAMGAGAAAPHRPFWRPVCDFLATHSSVDGEIALANVLEREEIRKITEDDKTLVWARYRSDGQLVYP
jgi:hypothetical protein